MRNTALLPCLVGVLGSSCAVRDDAIDAPPAPTSESPETGGSPDEQDASPRPTTGEPSLDEDSDDGDGVLFIEVPDGGASFECDLWAQDCGPGEKCNVWANDGGPSWNATKCVPIDPDADAIGEACTVVESAVSGLDSCELGAICWRPDEAGQGICVGFCQGSADNPTCEDPADHCEGRDVPLCLPTCCPIEQTCGAGAACYPWGDHFVCVPDASGDFGGYGDGCEFVNACDPGLACVDSQAVPGCEGSSGCCTRFCEVGSPECALLHPDLQCMPWYEPGHAPPGEELLGICALEQ